MYLSFETNELSSLDLKIIQLVGSEATPVAPGTTPASAPSVVVPIKAVPAEEPVAEAPAAKPAPAKKAAPAAKPAPKPEPEPEPEPVVEETVEETVEEDLVGGEAEPEPEGPTMADAVAAATKLVSSGGAPKVKAALGTVGAKRVSEIPVEAISEFLAALDAA